MSDARKIILVGKNAVVQNITGDNGETFVKVNPITGALLTEGSGSSGGKAGIVTITLPSNATQYAIGDVVGDTNGSAIFEFTGLGRANGQFIITAANLLIAKTAVPTGMVAGFNIHIFNASPTAVADNAAFTLPNGDLPKFETTIPLALPVLKAGSAISMNEDLTREVTLSATGSLFVEYETLSAFTPSSGAVKYGIIKGIEV